VFFCVSLWLIPSFYFFAAILVVVEMTPTSVEMVYTVIELVHAAMGIVSTVILTIPVHVGTFFGVEAPIPGDGWAVSGNVLDGAQIN
jgi:hypothetical protein